MRTSVSPTDRVLVIDDDDVMREVLSLLLGAESHDALTAESGDAALALLGALLPEQRPTVILTDLTMPGLSQDALAKRLRLACPPALLVAMSGSQPSPEKTASFDAFLLKPFTVADLEAAVQRARQGAAKAPKNGPHALRAGGAAPIQSLNEAVFSKLLSVMGLATLPQVYILFMEDAAVRIKRMRRAAMTDDEGALIHEAHAVKGGCGMLGAAEVQSLASRVEAGGLGCSSLLNDFGPALDRLRRILSARLDGFEEKYVDLKQP